ncbi:unnamed protein product, partial [Ectocarpus sp. 12 AP-2014]
RGNSIRARGPLATGRPRGGRGGGAGHRPRPEHPHEHPRGLREAGPVERSAGAAPGRSSGPTAGVFVVAVVDRRGGCGRRREERGAERGGRVHAGHGCVPEVRATRGGAEGVGDAGR